MDEKEFDALLNSDKPNKPEKVHGYQGSNNSREFVPENQRRKRREALSRLLASGMSNDSIYELMGKAINDDGTPGFNMSEASIDLLIKEVYAEWAEEDADRKPIAKSAAVRRIQRNIMLARQDKAWTAVASLEKVLMHIQGTAEPIEVSGGNDTRINNAILVILNESDPIELRKLIESERLNSLLESTSRTVSSEDEE